MGNDRSFKTFVSVKESCAKAQACQIADEARALYLNAPERSCAKEIYEALWIELADAEAPAKAQACQIADEAMTLYENAPSGSHAKEIYKARWIELVDAEAPTKAQACQTLDEARILCRNVPVESHAWKIYNTLLRKFLWAKARTFRTADKARTMRFCAPNDSLEEEIYDARCRELEEVEAIAKAQACQTANEARTLYENTPWRNRHETKIYKARLTELQLQGE